MLGGGKGMGGMGGGNPLAGLPGAGLGGKGGLPDLGDLPPDLQKLLKK
jgi:hypothetical protein